LAPSPASTNRPRSANEALPRDRLRAPLGFARGGAIVSVLRREQAVGDQGADGVGRAVDEDRHIGFLALGERVEHPVRRLPVTGRTADAEAHAEEVGRSERLLQRRPLWPAVEPPDFTRRAPKGRSISSCTAITWSGSMPCLRTSEAIAGPLSFMNARDLAGRRRSGRGGS